MATTYSNLYIDLRNHLREAEAFDPNRTARELICAASGKTAEEMLRDGPLYVPPKIEQEISDLADCYLAGEPLPYLIGRWEFYGMPLEITRDVLIPRPDTEVLAGCAIEAAAKLSKCRVLDLCAGSGCIGLAVAKHAPQAQVLLGELSEKALSVCRSNIRKNELGGRVSAMALDARNAPPASVGGFDLIVSNPPYIPSGDIPGLDSSVRDYEPHLALDGGQDGLDFYRSICRKWGAILRRNGKLLFEVGIDQASDVRHIMRSNGFADIQIINDLNGIPRVVRGTVRGERAKARKK